MANPKGKPLVWLRGEIKTPPFATDARIHAGYLLRQIQLGMNLSMPNSRPMLSIGPRCHELRLKDGRTEWRIVYRIDADAIVIAEVFAKSTRTTPGRVTAECRRRLSLYDDAR